jgi:hypothetical protein
MFDVKILDYMVKLQEHVKNDYLSWGNNSEYSQAHIPQLRLSEGKRFIKIIVMEAGSDRSAFGFIEKETGLVWKAAGWKAPALNFPRGNINDETGLKCATWTGIG